MTDHVTTEALRRIRSISNGIALHTPRFDFTRAIRQAAFSQEKGSMGMRGNDTRNSYVGTRSTYPTPVATSW